ncbi:hypothetical protein B0A50_07104 [Salinomyces thailandicus]|uniref:PH domain-containing protein n=1 Tax=Salinomyces thailandicus TaxID=706561 RepID=A0A4U0TNY1_9PEZI|nr:hypothetical protein B0A50_07104 [Salinomyces thailandica]
MTDVVHHHASPRPIPNTLSIPPSNSLPVPNASHARRDRSSRLTLDTFSPVTQNGSFEFDRVLKSGEVLKRTRKTKSWKPVFIVLRPNLISMYRDKEETKLRHQIDLSDLTAVARQKDPRRKEKHVFGLFMPSRNYHLEAGSDRDAQEWVELIRRQARMDADEEELYLASPGGASSHTYQGFGRSIDENISPPHDDRGGYTSSDADVLSNSQPLSQTRQRGSANFSARRPSHNEYSGADHGSYSDFSDSGMQAARMSALSLSNASRPSTSSHQQQAHFLYGQSSARPSMATRNPSQASGLGMSHDSSKSAAVQSPTDDERVIYHGWIYLLRTTSGVRKWKKIWMVLRPRALALYKNEEEYTALLIVPFHTVIDAVEIDPISRSKTSCMQLISQERSYRFCALDEESLARWLGAVKSLLSKRKAKDASKAQEATANTVPVAVQPP